MLSSIFSATVATTSGPEVGVFKRFQKKWPYINKSSFHIARDDDFAGMPLGLLQEMILFYTSAIRDSHPREDYRELLQLCLIFLGEEVDGKLLFRAPGAMYSARWMSKAIYSIKICLFKDQMQLTARETRGLMTVSLFVSLIYARFWHEAPVAQKAPLNDLKQLNLLHQYPVSDKASAALRRHLWYFSEHLVLLALFDERVDDELKTAMVRNLSCAPNKIFLKRMDNKNFDHCAPLSEYVTSRSMMFFDLLSTDGQEDSKSFLMKPPALRSDDATFQEMSAKVKLLKVVNDAVERRCALGIAPTYLLELFIPTSSCTGRQTLRSASRGDFVVPHARTAIKQHRAFAIVGPSLWNSLPPEIRSLPRDLSSSFYKLLKTFIFARAWAGSASE